MSKKICNPNCMYFNQEPEKIIKEYIDENGLKRRDAVFICGYDGHRITNYKKCSNCRIK